MATIVDPPANLAGLFSDVWDWAKHKGNRPGSPESRAGIVSQGDVQSELDKLTGGQPAPPAASIGGVPMDQVIMLSGMALAAVIFLSRQPARGGK